MADIFREVDEELQRERMEKLWKKHGSTFIGLCLAIVIATAGYVLYRDWRTTETMRITGDLAAAVGKVATAKDDDARALAVKSLAAFADKAPAGPAAIARLQQATAEAKAGDAKTAAATWRALADDAKADPLLRDLARLRLAALEIETAEPAALRARLEPLAAKDAPFRGSAGELLALLEIREGKPAEAAQRLRALSADSTLPETLTERAGRLADTLAAKE